MIKNEKLVKVKAVDWGYRDDSDGYEIKEGGFTPYIGWLHGQIVEETDDYLAIAHETFENNRVRKVTSIPKSAILERVDFEQIPEIPKGQQTCKRCGRSQYFEFTVKDEIWNMLPEKWRNKALCVDCFTEEMDNLLDGMKPLRLEDFNFIGIIGNKLRLVILDRYLINEHNL